MMLFRGRNQIPYWYSVYNCVRSSGIHHGVDIVGMDDKTICSTVAGTVQRATIVLNTADPTWEWGYYLRIDESNGNKHYFCHCAPQSFLVKPGQKVSAGTPLALMGKSGNAALATPPIEHVHYEVRTRANTYLDACKYAGIPNAVGVYSVADAELSMEYVSGLTLRVLTENKCQCFSAPNVNKIEKWGDSIYMPVGDFVVVQKAKKPDSNGMAWCVFRDGAGLLWCIYNLPDNRCELINTPVETPDYPAEIAALKETLTELANQKTALEKNVGELRTKAAFLENSLMLANNEIIFYKQKVEAALLALR